MPDSRVYLGRVPFDSSYKHSILFSSATDQLNQMMQHMTSAFSDDDYTFIREGAYIRVSVNADQLNGYNYCMYNNGNKWYYNFIVRIEYINEGTTAIHLERDVFQTWMFDYRRTACFVEREHVADDSLFAHTLPEPNLALRQTTQAYNKHELDIGGIVVLTTEYPTRTLGMVGAQSVSGGMYTENFSAALPLVFLNNAEGLAALQSFMNDMNTAGAAEAIVAMYLVPNEALVGQYGPLNGESQVSNPQPNTNVLYRNTAAEVQPVGIGDTLVPASLDGYTPRNNKLFCYPYTYWECGDFTGNHMQLLYELSNTSNHHIDVTVAYPLNANMAGVMYAHNYNGQEESNSVMTMDLAVRCPWTYQAYENWLGQNGFSLGLSLLTNAGQMVLGGMAVAGTGGLAALFGGGLMAQGAMGLANSASEMSRQMANPDQGRGNINGDNRLGGDTYGYYTCQVVPRREYAEMIDDFFDMFGYEVDRIKVPEFSSRPSWNYVKTQNCGWSGNVNLEDMTTIQNIYNSGITLWHTWDVGNYGLGNGV